MANILLVDDDLIFGKNLATILIDRGHSVELADSADSAFKQLEIKRFDIALLDIKLPDKSGIEVFEKINKSDPDIRVIIITAFACESLISNIADKDRFICFSKPFDINSFLSTIEKLERNLKGA